MRAVIYRRVSSPRQAATGASLEAQLEACRAYAAERGWRVVTDYVEAGRSAYRGDVRRRPQFQAMIDAAGRREFDVVLVYELSRFGRRRDAFAIGDDLERRGIRLVSVTEHFDVSTVEGFVTYSILAMQAELHSRMLSRRIKAVRAHERDLGRPAMRAPRGMRWGEKGIEPADDPALIRRAYDLADAGHSARAINIRLAEDGHAISLSSLHYLLRNPAYAGLIRHQGQLSPAAWPAIVPREQWERVQVQRAARHPKNEVRATIRSHGTSPLIGLLFCANCGAKLHYTAHGNGEPTQRNYFACSCHRGGGYCDARPSRADKLDAQIGGVVAALTLPPDALARAWEHVRAAATPTPRREYDPDATREALRRLSRAYADGGLSDQEYEERRAGLLARLAAALAPDPAAFDPEPGLRLLASLPALWELGTPAERRDLLRPLVSQVYARRHAIYAIRPTRLAAPALAAVWEQSRAMHNSPSQAGHSAIGKIVLLAA